MNSQLIRKVRKVPDAGKDGEQKRVLEDDMAGWHCQCNGLELGQTTVRVWEMVRDRETWHATVHGVAKS